MNLAAVQSQPPTTTVASTPLPRWLMPTSAFALSAIASTLCLFAAGPVHGVLFGSAIIAALLTPALAAGDRDWRAVLLVTAALSLGCVVGPLIALLQGDLNGRLFSALFAVVVPLVIGLAGVTALLTLCRVPPAIVATLLAFAALAWLSWPIWLSHWLPANEALVAALSPAHPLLTIDAAITREGGVTWLEHRWMYAKLTVIGQHVFPRHPAGVAAAATWHGGIGAACLLIVTTIQLWTARRAKRHAAYDDFEAV